MAELNEVVPDPSDAESNCGGGFGLCIQNSANFCFNWTSFFMLYMITSVQQRFPTRWFPFRGLNLRIRQWFYNRVYTRTRLWCGSRTRCQKIYLIVAPFWLTALAVFVGLGAKYFSYQDKNIAISFHQTCGGKLDHVEARARFRKTLKIQCMLECRKRKACFSGFYDSALSRNNCFLFSAPPAFKGHAPVWNETSTTFLKKKKLEVDGAKVERAKEDGLYYYASRTTMKSSDMVDYCADGNMFYYPAIMGLNNSAYQVARSSSAQLYPEEYTQRKYGLMFLMAIGSPDSSSKDHIERGYAFVGQDALLRDRLVRFIFYKDDMLEFFNELTSDQEFHVLCQADPLNMQGDDWLRRSLFFAAAPE